MIIIIYEKKKKKKKKSKESTLNVLNFAGIKFGEF